MTLLFKVFTVFNKVHINIYLTNQYTIYKNIIKKENRDKKIYIIAFLS